MKISLLYVAVALLLLAGCKTTSTKIAVRQPVDTVGFAHYTWQVDSLLNRIERYQPARLKKANNVFADDNTVFRLAISPHDDYSYVGYLYPALFKHVRSEVVIMFGVAHKAKRFNLQDKIVFGSIKEWKSPGGFINVSPLQEKIMKELPSRMYLVHDSMQIVEHSLEALVPFIEHYKPNTEIIPIIVPYMNYERMEEISAKLAPAIKKVMSEAGLEWGSGYSIVLSSDAVHYGNEDWGGKNYDRYGVDSTGYFDALAYEKQLMIESFVGTASDDRVKSFYQATVSDTDYKEYKWTWCGRYSIPLGMLTAIKLAEADSSILNGRAIGYSTSIANDTIPVHDIGMGQTAPAKLTHWVGYPAVGFQ
ncbi:MAG TPA: AmmeMemoRadiSam system protein B [Bacteroidales bacterium]|nr:AmmeMemoRadiSam system protein B [Bacteroidales bacterium]